MHRGRICLRSGSYSFVINLKKVVVLPDLFPPQLVRCVSPGRQGEVEVAQNPPGSPGISKRSLCETSNPRRIGRGINAPSGFAITVGFIRKRQQSVMEDSLISDPQA